jgi:hypothetical protein
VIGRFGNWEICHLPTIVPDRYTPLAERIEAFWLERPHREAGSWLAHREINMVVLATSLAPDGYLRL